MYVNDSGFRGHFDVFVYACEGFIGIEIGEGEGQGEVELGKGQG